MKILCDCHTHTVSSGHAYSTVDELARQASAHDLELMAMTDHAPTMPGGAHIYHFYNLKVIPPVLHGVRVLRGVEANIVDGQGRIDMDDEVLGALEWVVASMHQPCYESLGLAGNTEALVRAMDHPRINVIGHPDDGRYPLDYRALVLAAKEKKVLLEVNNSSLMPTAFRESARENYLHMVELCAEENVGICVNSDAHFHLAVGQFPKVLDLLSLVHFPPELVVNRDALSLKSYFDSRGTGSFSLV